MMPGQLAGILAYCGRCHNPLSFDPCPFCDGTGKFLDERCFYCGGEGGWPICEHCHAEHVQKSAEDRRIIQGIVADAKRWREQDADACQNCAPGLSCGVVGGDCPYMQHEPEDSSHADA